MFLAEVLGNVLAIVLHFKVGGDMHWSLQQFGLSATHFGKQKKQKKHKKWPRGFSKRQ